MCQIVFATFFYTKTQRKLSCGEFQNVYKAMKSKECISKRVEVK